MKMKKENNNKEEMKLTKKNIVVIIIMVLVILIPFVYKIIKEINKFNESNEEKEYKVYVKYYGNMYGEKIKKIALLYYLENGKMISSNELEDEINKVEDYKFYNSEIKFSDIKCESIHTDDNGILKLIDCNSDEFDSKIGYTYEANISDEVAGLTYKNIDSEFTEKSMQGLAQIKGLNLSTDYSVGCGDNEEDNKLIRNHQGYVLVTRNGEKAENEEI